ncbi:hypothetical protein F8388_020992 [Cannabis sativa]|uniref:Endopeptidase S2P n=1 Tax=Cannabis sativa TaxID=3483 RepID=A0A7J6DV16_CANSA|nr:hypothetical protein G4B88_024089 [Cannabis sativa]KAF4349409.1 hypothetical protein F8388_020992 [Cannabis sativa]
MEGRRLRRARRGRNHTQLLPLSSSSTSSSGCCWYLDYKILFLNQPLFRFGRTHAALLTPWFSIGVGFTLTTLLAVSLILLWDLARTLHIFPESWLGDLSSASLFGFWPFSSSPSAVDAIYVLLSTIISVSFHEFGHALAAASEGVEMEYIAIFIAFVFPGALVAFNHNLLQSLTHFASLRIYCAGIWHNAVCCSLCGLTLFLLPWILFPFYQHTGIPMVLAVPSSSPLSGYLSPGDLIVSMDGATIKSPHQWIKMADFINKLAIRNTNHSRYAKGIGIVNSGKGYCVPHSLLEESIKMQLEDHSGCPDDLAAFATIPCFDKTIFDDQIHCLNAKQVVKHGKCGDGWVTAKADPNSCICSQDRTCSSPIQRPGMIWVEVSYLRPYSEECLQHQSKVVVDSRGSDIVESNCGGTIVFVGDVISMASSVQLTAYQPRWPYFGAYLPNILEKIFVCTFHVSITLALLNSLPVYFLDGESVLEGTLCHFTSLGSNKRGKILRLCLLGGTLISLLTLFRIFFKFL